MSALVTVRELYDRGRYLDALEASRPLGPLDQWPGPDGGVLAGRLAIRLGGPRLGSRLHVRTWRAHRDRAEPQYYYLLRLADRQGAFATWTERQRLGPPGPGDERHLSDYHGQCSQLLAQLRDFARAEEHLARSADADPRRAYGVCELAGLRIAEDRYDSAWRAVEQGLADFPEYPPLVLMAWSTLSLLDRPDDALSILRSAAERFQSSEVVATLIRLLLKLRRLDEAESLLPRYEALTPLRERELQSWLATIHAELAVCRGDYPSALTWLEQTPHPFHAAIVENLRAFLEAKRGPARRIELSVPFVRQHQMTCAPATLSAISRFWGRAAEHLSLAEEICYDGTPWHSERRWAEENGWRCREFRVDWDNARALIDRGLPFTLTTSAVASAHLQAVIGYDDATGVLLTRDPMQPESVEMLAARMLEQQRATGPRGMAMVPAGQELLLDGIELADAEQYDRYNRVQLALHGHDRESAAAAVGEMSEAEPRHRLSLRARISLAWYDGNPHEARGPIEELLTQHPYDADIQLMMLDNLRTLAPRAQVLERLRSVLEQPHPSPRLLVEYAVVLAVDDRGLPEAIWHTRRALRRAPDDAFALSQLAHFFWRSDRRTDALAIYRIVACLEPTREHYAASYFQACRLLGDTETGLAFLRDRVQRLGARAAGPAVALFNALEGQDQTAAALSVLDDVVARRPDDGDLMLLAASRYARYGRPSDAAAALARADGRVKRTAWLAALAAQARLDGRRDEALEHLRAIVAIQPFDLDAHDAIARLLSETRSATHAIEHLRANAARFPHHFGLQKLLYDWTGTQPAVDRERELRRLAAIDPSEPWTLRALALNLTAQGRYDDALVAADEALRVDATTAAGHTIRGRVAERLGRRSEAADAYREALRRSAEETAAMNGLLATCGDSVADRRASIALIESELLRQPGTLGGVDSFRLAARGVFTPAELAESLHRIQQRRQDLWFASSALARHLTEMGRSEEALALLTTAVDRFPYTLQLWLDLAAVHRRRGGDAERIAALERAREIEPEATDPIHELGDAYLAVGRVADARRLLEGAIERMPLMSTLRGHLAQLMYHAGEGDRAIETLCDALRRNPDYLWAWGVLADWTMERGTTGRAIELAREFTHERPGEPSFWVRLAEFQLRAGVPADALESAAQAISIDPRFVDAHDMVASALADQRRFDEAEAACRPAAFGAETPMTLQGRAAWVRWHRGDGARAIEAMERLLDRHGDYQWGWQQLLEWLAATGANEKALNAAERLAWLKPDVAVPLGWQGDLRLRMGDKEGAMSSFRRAMAIDPSYLFAGFGVFDLQVAAKDLEGAQRTLEILEPFAPPARLLFGRLALAAATAQTAPQSLSLMDELCRMQAAEPGVLDDAAKVIVRAGRRHELIKRLRRTIEGGHFNAHAPALWVRLRTESGRYGGPTVYRWLKALGDPGREAAGELLDAIGHAGARTGGSLGLLARLWIIKQFAEDWRKNDEFWGKYGFALLSLRQPGSVLKWMRGWRSRRTEPWMLNNLVAAALMTRKDSVAREVLRHVATEVVRSHSLESRMKLWCSIGASLDGDPALAKTMLADASFDPQANAALKECAAVVIAILQQPTGAPSPDLIDRIRAVHWSPEADRPSRRLIALARHCAARHLRATWLSIETWWLVSTT